MPTKYF